VTVPSTPGEQPMPSRRSLRAAQQAREEAELLAQQSAAQSAGPLPGAAASDTAVPAETVSDSDLPTAVPAVASQPIEAPAEPRDAVAELFGAEESSQHDASGVDVAGGAGKADSDKRTGGAAARERRRAELAAEPPRGKRTKRKGAWGCLVALVVIIALLAAGAWALRTPITQLIASVQGPADYPGTGDADVVVMIHEGDTGADIARTLAGQNVVQSFDAFYDVLLKELPEPVFQPGAYQLKTRMSAQSAYEALQDPTTKLQQTVVVPEGTAAVDVLQLLSEGTELPLSELEAAAADVASFGLPSQATTLEGFLFPATYTFVPGISAHDAIQTLVQRQFKALDSAGVAVDARWSTIVLASLIQREAGLRDDYYKVSRVFLNRNTPALWASGLMQSDATVAYGTGNTHLVTTTDAERADASNLYNTYVHPGLPIGPISNPGDLAIDAALHPAEGSWLFFVTVNLDTGETVFSNTLAEHEAAVVTWQDWMRANRG